MIIIKALQQKVRTLLSIIAKKKKKSGIMTKEGFSNPEKLLDQSV